MSRGLSDYKIDSVCSDPWAVKVRRYWKYLGGGDCCVLLGKSNGHVLLITTKNELTGDPVYGVLVEEPLVLPKHRSLVWHEMGHVRGVPSSDPVEHEFNADKWAIETAMKKGFSRVVEEIILRCSSYLSNDKVNEIYKASGRMVLLKFIDVCTQIIKDHKTNG
jgi:hypothetical protein